MTSDPNRHIDAVPDEEAAMSDRTGGKNRAAVNPAQLNRARKTLTSLSARVSSSRSSSGTGQSTKPKTR
jgi:hypothetical protein